MFEHHPKFHFFLISAALYIIGVSLPPQTIYAQSQRRKVRRDEPEQELKSREALKKKEASKNLLSTLKRSGFFHKKKRPSFESTNRCVPLSWDVSPAAPPPPKTLTNEAPFSTSGFHKDNPFVVVSKNTPTKDVAQKRGLKYWKTFPVRESRIAEIVNFLIHERNDLNSPAITEIEEFKAKESISEPPRVELLFPLKTSGKSSTKQGGLLIQRTSLEVSAHYSWDGGIVWVRKQNGTKPVSGARVALRIPGKKLKETVTDKNGFARLSGDSIRSANGPLVLTVNKNEEHAFIVLKRDSSPPPRCLAQGRLVTNKNTLKPGEPVHFAGVGRRVCLDSNPPGKKTYSLTADSSRLYAVLRMHGNVLNKKQIHWKHGDLVWGKLRIPTDAPAGVGFLSLEYFLETESGSTPSSQHKNPALPGAGYPVAEVQIQSTAPELKISAEKSAAHWNIGLRLMRLWRYPPGSLMAHYKLTSLPQFGESQPAFVSNPQPIKEGMTCFDKNGIAGITVPRSYFKGKLSRLRVEVWVILPDGHVLRASRVSGVKEQNKWSIKAPAFIFTREIGFIQVMPPVKKETLPVNRLPILVLSNNTQKKEELIESPCFKIGFWGLIVCPFRTHKKGKHIIQLISGNSVADSTNSKNTNVLAKTFLYAQPNTRQQKTNEDSAQSESSPIIAQKKPVVKSQTDRDSRFSFWLHPDKSSYKEGDTAKIFVSIPETDRKILSSSSAILTIHGQGFWSSKNITILESALKDKKPVIEIPVVRWMAPRIEIGLFLQTNTGRHGARTQMNIDPSDNRLDLQFTVEPKKPKAGKPLCISAHTTTSKGEPVSTVIAFTIHAKTTAGFMQRSIPPGNVVSAKKSQTLLNELKPSPAWWVGLSDNKMIHRWADINRCNTSGPYWRKQLKYWDETPFRDRQNQANKRNGLVNSSPSLDSPLLVIATSPAGSGGICINAPKRAGKYKLRALASAAQQNRGGTGWLSTNPQENFIVWKELEIEADDQIDFELSGPEWVTQGDRVCANAGIRNLTSQIVETKIRWSLQEDPTQEPKVRILKLPPRGRKNLSLCFSASKENKLTLKAKAETPGCSVHRKLVFKNRRLTPLISFHRHGRLMPGKGIKATPPGCVKSLETIWSTNPSLRLFTAFNRLISYSPETLEALVGSILALSSRKELPPSLVTRALRTHGFTSDPIELLNRQAKKLSSLQRPDFIFSMHTNGPAAPVLLQLAGAQALLKARSSGAAIPNVDYHRAINLFKLIAERKIPGVSDSDQISSLQSLSDEGYPVAEEIKNHTSRLKEKNLCDLSGLLLTAHRAQLEVSLLDRILAQIQQQLSRAAAHPSTAERESYGFEKNQNIFQQPTSGPPRSDILIPSDCLSNILNTLHETLPGHELVNSAAKILWKQSLEGVWETKITTARAMSALSSHWTRHQGPLANARVKVSLKKQTVMEAWFVGHTRQTAHYNLPKEFFLRNTPRRLHVEVLGETHLFGYLHAHHVCSQAPVDDKTNSKNHGISSILRVKDSKKTDVPELFKEKLELYQGERAQIRMVFAVGSNPHQPCLYEPIPGGLELQRIGVMEDRFTRFPSPEVLWSNRRRGGIFFCFSHMEPGLYEIAYIVKAKHLGHYHTARPELTSWKTLKQPVGSPWPITIVKKPANHQRTTDDTSSFTPSLQSVPVKTFMSVP